MPPPTGTIEFAFPTYDVGEGDGFAVIELVRVGGTASEISATLRTGDGTAAAGVDFSAVVQQVAFAHGDTTPKLVQVPILDDAFVEGNETLVLEIVLNPLFPARSSAALTIADDEQVAVPSLSAWGLALLAAGLAAVGWRRLGSGARERLGQTGRD